MRQPHPWYSENRSGGGWFVKLAGVHQFLGKHPVGTSKPEKRNEKWNPPPEILATFYQLMAVRDTASKSDYTLETVFALFLEQLQEENPKLAKRYEPVLGKFCDHEYKNRRIGKLLVNAEADCEHLKSWAKKFPSEQTQRTYINTVKTSLNWAVSKKSINITKNPFAELKVPKISSRTVVITKTEHEALVNRWNDTYRDFLKALWVTGRGPARSPRLKSVTLTLGFCDWNPLSTRLAGSLARIV